MNWSVNQTIGLSVDMSGIDASNVIKHAALGATWNKDTLDRYISLGRKVTNMPLLKDSTKPTNQAVCLYIQSDSQTMFFIPISCLLQEAMEAIEFEFGRSGCLDSMTSLRSLMGLFLNWLNSFF